MNKWRPQEGQKFIPILKNGHIEGYDGKRSPFTVTKRIKNSYYLDAILINGKEFNFDFKDWYFKKAEK